MAHLIWDWNGTLLDDVPLVVAATNAALAVAGCGPVTVAEHRQRFVRPVSAYYSGALGRPVTPQEFARLDQVFHDHYRAGVMDCRLAADALAAMAAWAGSQSLLSMYFHGDLVTVVKALGVEHLLCLVDGLRAEVGGGGKATHLAAHLRSLGLRGEECVLIGDCLDDAEAADSVGAAVVLYLGGITDENRLRASGRPVAQSLIEAVALATALGGALTTALGGAAAGGAVMGEAVVGGAAVDGVRVGGAAVDDRQPVASG